MDWKTLLVIKSKLVKLKEDTRCFMHPLKLPHDAKAWSIPVVFNLGRFCQPCDFWQCPQIFFFSVIIVWGLQLARGQSCCCTPYSSQNIPPARKKHVVPRINNLDAKKPWSILIGSSIGASLLPCSPLPNLYFKNNFIGDFPTGPVVQTPCFQYKGPEFNPWSGTWSHMLQLRICTLQLKILCAATKTWHSQTNK